MNKKKYPSDDSLDLQWKDRPDIYRFSHAAMATIYEIFIQHENYGYAEGAAHEAFKVVDRLEEELSRFIENSDISRVNNLRAFESTKIGLSTFDCLEAAKRIFEETNGAFDISIGPLYQIWLNKDKTLRQPSDHELANARYRTGLHLVKLNKSEHTVKVLRDNLHLDLGGIGKGYAVDKVGELLMEWGINTALIHGGKSSVLALDAPDGLQGWPVTLTRSDKTAKTIAKVHLRNLALSGSGLQKGQHIINPREGKPVQKRSGSWTIAPAAVEGDALSTAFMIMNPEEVEAYCEAHTEIRSILVLDKESPEAEVHLIGNWEEENLLEKYF